MSVKLVLSIHLHFVFIMYEITYSLLHLNKDKLVTTFSLLVGYTMQHYTTDCSCLPLKVDGSES